MSVFDYIIVGQGLAGTVLSFELKKRSQSVLVIDNNFKDSSSMVAAGMWNPIVFKRLSKSWKADELLPELYRFYREIGTFLGGDYLVKLPIDRVFPDLASANQFDEKSDLPGFENYLSQEEVSELTSQQAPFGCGRIQGGGFLKIQELLMDYRNYLRNEGAVLEQNFEASALNFLDDLLEYQGHKAKHIIFCVGHNLSSTPWFSDLPIQPTKGELLSIDSPKLNYNSILNNGKFLMPLGDGKFKLGATYEWEDLELRIKDESKKQLLEHVETFLKEDFQVTAHEVGLRPTVKDRRPLLGAHPNDKRLLIFNGLGTKGVMIAPWLAVHFCDFLDSKSTLEKEIDVKRYFK